jgi:hypothetical protein
MKKKEERKKGRKNERKKNKYGITKKFPVFIKTQVFITESTTACRWALS